MPRAWVVAEAEVVSEADVLARIHAPDFDPRAVALAETPVACTTDPAKVSTVTEVRDEGNRIEAHVRGGGGLLVFSEIYYPGWRASIDGDRVPITQVDYLLRATCIPPGEHQVVLEYEPPLLKVGLAVTGLALTAIGGAVVWMMRRRRAEVGTRT